MKPARVTAGLVPWDPESPDHINRLIEQRIDCGWDKDKPDGPWKKAQLEGRKCIYWIVLPEEDPETKAKLEWHITAHPKQNTPLLDTCTTLRGVSLEPSKKEFMPVGHIALDTGYPEVDKFNLDIPKEGVIWIKSLYITTPLQYGGLGRAAIDALEAMATSEPLSARTLMLDTMHRDDQMELKHPKMVNQDWYARRGYRLIGTVPDYYDMGNEFAERGVAPFTIRTVFMRMDLVGGNLTSMQPESACMKVGEVPRKREQIQAVVI